MSNEVPFVEFPVGTAIIREGEPAAAMYILESGKATVERAEAPGVALAEFGPGDFFGEMSILQEQPNTATVTARAHTRALRIDAAAFHGVLRENPEVALQLMRRLVLRLRGSEQRRVTLEAQVQRGGPAAAATAPGAVAPASARAAAPAPRPVAQTPTLPYVLEHPEGRIPLVGGKGELVVGRPDPATGTIPEINFGNFEMGRSLSRRHARILVNGNNLSVREEPGVGNGTWVNGERLQPEQTVAVKEGDVLRFGAIEVRLSKA